MTSSHSTPYDKAVATFLGYIVVMVDAWFTASCILSNGGDAATVAISLLCTISAACSMVFSEYAWARSQYAKAIGFVIFFGLTSVYNFSLTVERVGKAREDEVAIRQGGNENRSVLEAAFQAAKEAKEAECGKRGPKCREAEKTLQEASQRLVSAPANKTADVMGNAIAALTGLNPVTIRTWQPMLIASAIQFGGVLLIAYGHSPRRKGKETIIEPQKPMVLLLDGVKPNEQEIFNRFVALVASQPSGTLIASDRQIAKMIKVNTASTNNHLRKWRAARYIHSDGSGRHQRTKLLIKPQA